MTARLKVLVSAYACNPRKGSEAGVGWGWVNAIAKYHELWVITDEAHRPDIDRELEANPGRYSNLHFCYLRRTRWLALERVWPPAYLRTYKMWQRQACRLGEELHREIGFDLAHQLTYVGFRIPGFIWKLNMPFVWGPIGGLENTPWRFLPLLGVKGFVYYGARNIINSLQKRFLVSARAAFRKADGGIIAATEGIREEILRWYGLESEVICETGPPDIIAEHHSVRGPDEPLRLAWSGLHDPAKALPLLLRALSGLTADIDWRLDILGRGPCTGSWQKQSVRLGLADRCTWHGWLPREEALRIMRDAHVFVISSLKDLTSTVLLEALALGVPVICFSHCGFRYVVTDQCGIKLPAEKTSQMVPSMAAAIRKLADDEGYRRVLARGALARSRDFSWDKKAEEINRIYKQVTAGVKRNAG